MSDTTTTDRADAEQGTTVTLIYSTRKGEVVRRPFKGLTEDDIVAVTASLAARRMTTKTLHIDDMQQIKAMNDRQVGWYADRLVEALCDGMGRWFRWAPSRVRARTIDLVVDYLRDMAATWSGELIALNAEVNRANEQARRNLRPQPVAEPLVSCRCCDATFRRADCLPKGWTADDDCLPRCPKHPAEVI